MANKDLQKQLNQLERSLNQSKINTDGFRKAIQEAGDDTEKLTRIAERMADALDSVDASATSLSSQLLAIGQEFDKQLGALNKTKGAFRKITRVAEQLRDDEQGITDLTKSQVKKLQQKLKTSKSILASQKDSLRAEIESGNLTKNQQKEADAMYNTAMDESKAIALTLKKSKERLELESKINKQMGVAGSLIGGAGALMERLGMRSGIFQESVQDAMEDMRELSKATAESSSFMNKLEVAGTGFLRVAKGLGDAIADPTSIGMLLLDTMTKINEQSVEISRLTGQYSANFEAFETGATSAVDSMEVVAELTKQTGLSAQNAFSQENIIGAAKLKVELGLASEQAGSLAMMAETSTQNVDQLTDSVVGATNEFNGANRTAIAQGVILRDVADASEGVRASFNGSAEALAKGAAAARRLGMNIGELDQIASSLLDFESSIGNELEAQLLTGKNINLAKARELALNNDLAGLGEELFENSASLAEFGKMNRIQQEAQAEAVGMTRDQLAKVAYQRAVNLKLSDQEIKNATGVEASEMRRVEAAKNFQRALEKIAASLAPIMEKVADVLSMPFVPQLLLGTVAAGKLLSKVKGIGQGMLNFGSSIMKAAKNFDILNAKQAVFGKTYKGGQFMRGGGRAKKGGERAGGLFSKVLGKGSDKKLTKTADKTQEVAKKSKNVPVGKNIRKFLKNIAAGLRSLGDPKVLFGAANLIPASIGFIAMIPGAVGMAAIAALGKPTSLGLQALGKGLTSFGTAMMGPGGVGLLAFVGAAIGLGAAFALVGAGAMMFGKGIEFAANGVTKIFNGLTGLISSIPQLYLLGGALMSIAAGLGSIAVAGVSAIPALAALGTFAVMSAPLVALGGLFESQDSGGDNSEMITLLREIRDEVKQGGDVILDGNKVGEALVLGSYISS